MTATCKQMKLEHSLVPHTNVGPDTIKLLEGNVGRTLFDINHSKIFFSPLPTVKKIKTKINKRELIKLESFCTAKETINIIKRQPSEWEKRRAMKQLMRD